MTGAELPIGERKARAVEEMFDRIAPRYELVNRVMTLGLDAGWRRRAVRELHLDPGARVVDLGCGTGDLCRVLGRAGLRAVGVDMAAEMLARAHTSAPLVRADALQLPLGDAIGRRRDQRLRAAQRGRHRRVLPRGGASDPSRAAAPSSLKCRSLRARSCAGCTRCTSGGSSRWSAGCSPTGARTSTCPRRPRTCPRRTDLLRLLTDAGFARCRRVQLGPGAAQLLIGTRR